MAESYMFGYFGYLLRLDDLASVRQEVWVSLSPLPYSSV